MMLSSSTITVPVLCPADGCWDLIDCTVVTMPEPGTDAVRSGVIGMTVSVETALAEVALHLLTAHPELCETAPADPSA